MSDFELQPPKPVKRKTSIPVTKILGFAFGIFMVFVYVGMGILLLINFFGWAPSYDWVRYMMFPILVAYGLFRGWRAYKDLTRYKQDDEDDEQQQQIV